MKRLISLLLASVMMMSVCTFCTYAEAEKENGEFPFGDVPASRWSNPYVVLLQREGIVGGKTENVFAPMDNVKRAEFVKMLAGVAGADMGEATHTFTDVKKGSWYEPYVAWAASEGIVNGMSADKFAPDAQISRQDMATMIYRYVTNVLYAEPAEPPVPVEPIAPTEPDSSEPTEATEPSESDEPTEGVIPTEPTEPEEPKGLPTVNEAITFSDDADIADYAKEGVSAMQQAGIIGGVTNGDDTYRFEPKNKATREQSAKMLAMLYLIINEDKELPEPVQPKAYTIKYSTGFGQLADGAPREYRSGEGTKVPNPTKEGYTFEGWTGTGLGKPVKNLVLNHPVAGDLTLTAKWTPTKYKITYQLNGGTVSDAPTWYTIETNGLAIPIPKKAGSVFKGWRVNNKGSLTSSISPTRIYRGTTGDRLYSAEWQEVTPQEYATRVLCEWIDERDDEVINGVPYYVENTTVSTSYASSIRMTSIGKEEVKVVSSAIIGKYQYVVTIKLTNESKKFSIYVEMFNGQQNLYEGNGKLSFNGASPDFTLTRKKGIGQNLGRLPSNIGTNLDEDEIRRIAEQELKRTYKWLNDVFHNRIKSGKYDMSCFGL